MLRHSFSERPTRLVRARAAAIIVLAVVFLGGCVLGPRLETPDRPAIPEGGDAVPAANDVVLEPGQQLVANAPWGPIKIEAGPGMRRVYNWRNMRRGVILEPREQRFAGSMGIYYEGTPPVWESANGLTQVDLEEGHRNFENINDAMIWMQINRLRYVYTNDGLVVGWKPDGDTFKAEVWQFHIDGDKPTSLPGASDDRIRIEPLQVVEQRMQPVRVYNDGRREPVPFSAAVRADPANTQQIDQIVAAAPTPATGGDGSADDSEQSFWQRLFGGGSSDTASAGTASADTASADPAASTTADAATGSAAANRDETESSDEPAAPAEPERPRAEISGNVVNVRSGPTTDAEVLMQARQGDAVTILQEDADWRYVEFEDGRKGWVANFLLDHED